MKIPASYHQERLWFIDKFESGTLYDSSPIYHNIPLILEINGTLDFDILEQSILGVIRRHEALRTQIISEDDKPIQLIKEKVSFELKFMDVTNHWNGDNGYDKAIALAFEEAERPFLLDKESLIRGKLIKVKNKKFILVITIHHIIADRNSLIILVREILIHYQAFLKNIAPQLPELNIHYADFSNWQREFSLKLLKSLLLYWKMKLHGDLPILEIPTDRPRVLIHTYKSSKQSFAFTKNLNRKINTFCNNRGISKFIVLLGVFKALLWRYTGQEEIIVGTSVSNRSQPGTEGIIGPISNLLVLRSNLTINSIFRGFLTDLSKTVNDAFEYQILPFDKLVLELNPDPDMSRTALFDVLFQYEEETLQSQIPKVENLDINLLETNLGWGKYDMNILIQRQEQEKGGDSYNGILVYNSDYYNASTISRFIGHYMVLLEDVLEYPDIEISRLSLLTGTERRLLLTDWNRTQANYPKDKTIHQIFKEQVEKGPDNVAVVYEDHTLTYRFLDDQANCLAYHLRSHNNIQPEIIIAILMEPSIETIVGILGIIKAGGAYLPIDPDYPEQRIVSMLEDSGTTLLLTHSIAIEGKSLTAFEQVMGGREIVLLDELNREFYREAKRGKRICVEDFNQPHDLAYIIYTSGSTGKPKGCMISHGDVVRLLKNDRIQQLFDFNRHDTWIMAHSVCFDFSVWEMYGALLNGGQLVIPSRDVVRDVSRFHSIVKQYKITVLNQTPAAFYRFISMEMEKEAEKKTLSRHMRYVIFGGDKLEPDHLREWIDIYPLEEISLINMYGITETTVHVTFYRLTEDDIKSLGPLSPVGKPLPEKTLYIYNDNLSLQPIGITGEIYVGGSGVSQGYLNRCELSAKRFFENPYKKGEMIYKTGDLGKRLSDGNVEFLGRKDHQVKIRGFRIEPGEIESHLLNHEKIKSAVVLVKTDDNEEKYLCAYIAIEEGLDITDLRGYLSSKLPNYMIPAYFIKMNNIPLTPNGKVDRKALSEVEIKVKVGEGYVEPRNKLEKKLAEIWSEALGVEMGVIGIDANFFELGGHSLKATILLSNIHKTFDIKIPLKDFFIYPTIREISKKINITLLKRSKDYGDDRSEVII